MTTVTRRHAAGMKARAKKAIAVVSAGALVASLGYFHLWGSTPAVAANDADRIEVLFNLDSDVIVEVGGETFDAQSESGYLASVADDLRFKASVRDGRSDRSIEAVEAVLQAAATQPAARKAAASAAEPAVGTEAGSEGNKTFKGIEADPAVRAMSHEGSDKSANVIEIVSEDQAASEDAAVPSDEVAASSDEGKEVVSDDATPMAATAGGEEGSFENGDSTTEIIVAYDADADEYVVAKSELLKAAAAQGTIEITVTSEALGETFDNWDSLANFLGEEGDDAVKVKLTSDLVASHSVVVKGNKTLDLNGFTITSEVEGPLFMVGDEGAAATFTINDSSSKYREFDQSSEGVLVPKPSKDNAGDLRNGVLGEFCEKWVGQEATLEGDTLTYYVTRSYEDKKIVGGTNEYQIKHTVDMGNVGAIRATKKGDLVVVDNGASVLNIEGGHLFCDKGVTGDIHAVNLNKGGSFHMSGGFITGVSAEGHGAAISANNKDTNAPIDIVIDGTAVIAGNNTVKNGGAIWMSSETSGNAALTIGGNAVIAGNVAGKSPLTDLTKGTIATTMNGGAVYASKNCNVTVTGSAVISGNTANADGGGIYVEGHKKGTLSTNTLTIEQNATITNNRSENNRMSVHQKDRSTGVPDESDFWKNYGGGGGGVFTLGDTVINGGQITSNFASDGGGGIFALGATHTVPTKWNSTELDTSKEIENALPVLKIENCRISSNYAGTSEGGGILAGTAKASYIKQGIISNNMTATYFDYGGGGLFMSSIDQGKTAGMTVHHPLISGNTAAGLGGGVASCTNGIVVSGDAAVFDNTALAENCTQNPNEYGDQWLLEGNLKSAELKDGRKTYGLKEKIGKKLKETGLANDFYCAKESKVFNSMLGGGFYNWEGYTTGDVAGGEAYAYRESWKGDKYLNIGTSKISVTNVFYRSNENLLRVIVPADRVDEIDSLAGYLVEYKTIDLSKTGSPAVHETRIVLSVDDKVDFIENGEDKKDSCSPGDEIRTLHLSDPVDPADYKAKPTDITLTGAYTRTENIDDYPMYKIDEDTLTKTDTTCIESKRLLLLKANPSDTDKDNASKAAVLFFTGNYSNTHGGAIACNDYIDVGAAGKEFPGDPDNPGGQDDVVGKMTLAKKLTGWNGAEHASATAVFNVTGYEDVEAYKASLEPIYVNQIGFTFNADDSAEKELTDLPLGYYVVEEEFYTGDNFKQATGRNTWTVTLTHDNAEAGVSHEFTNNFKDENTFGTGVVNSYTSGQDGEFTYTPDANYNNRKQPSAPIEGGN